jgi:ferredoxin
LRLWKARTCAGRAEEKALGRCVVADDVALSCEALMKVRVTEDCIACGLCVDTCPEAFDMGDEFAEVIVDEVPEEAQEACRQAAEECPVEAIVVEEDE